MKLICFQDLKVAQDWADAILNVIA